MKLFRILMSLLFLNFLSCNDLPKDVKRTLELAGDNERELQKVIDHYQAPDDSLKLKATYFLIGNMSNKYSLAGGQLENYNVIFDKIEAVSKSKSYNYIQRTDEKYHEIDSIWKEVSKKEGPLSLYDLEIRPDVHYITSDFLVENIEYAFKAWELPWSKHLDFDTFCEYILPYRFKDEVLTSWRSYVFNKYSSLLDSLGHIKDPITICDTINKRLSKFWKYSRTMKKYPVTMTMEQLDKGKMGTCTNEAALGVFTMRALGIPVVHEQVPHYANRSLGHDFNAVLDRNNKFLDFEVIYRKMGEVIKTRNRWNFIIPKIYRQTFTANKELLKLKRNSQEEIPPYFRNVDIMDVTSDYLPVTDINVKLTQPRSENVDYAYLCVFDNKNWRAVSWSEIINGEVSFKNMGRGLKGILYLPMYYVNKDYIPAANPIILNADGNFTSVDLLKEKETLLLDRKYHLPGWSKKVMVKGKFQAANDISFRDKVTLYEVDTLDALVPQDLKIENSGKHRYARYLFPPNNIGNIAEMTFYSETENELKGSIITSENITKGAIAEKAFDGDVLSFVNTRNRDSVEQWVGLDLGTKKRISKISFCPRTDKNDVWKGLNYELLYWDMGWVSLGTKKAEAYSLTYESPVSNTLYLLRCLDEGNEERIFTYEENKQVWW